MNDLKQQATSIAQLHKLIHDTPERTDAYFVLISHLMTKPEESAEALKVAEMLFTRVLTYNSFSEK
jgi:hypothetical protein